MIIIFLKELIEVNLQTTSNEVKKKERNSGERKKDITIPWLDWSHYLQNKRQTCYQFSYRVLIN